MLSLAWRSVDFHWTAKNWQDGWDSRFREGEEVEYADPEEEKPSQ